MLISNNMDIPELTKLVEEKIGNKSSELIALNMRYLLVSNSYVGTNTENVPSWVWDAYLLRAIKAV